MADYQITISNSVRFFGGGPSSLWNASYAIWGSFNWGEGTVDMLHSVGKLISESITPSDSISSKSVTHLLSETLSTTSDMYSEVLSDGSGYNYVFPSNETNFENRDDATWVDGTVGSQNWTSASVASITWS